MRHSTHPPFTCVTCEAEIRGRAVFHTGVPFCCAGCVAGGPCTCSYDPDDDDAVDVRHCLDVAEPVAFRAASRPRAPKRVAVTVG